MSDKGVGKYNVVVIGAGTAGLVTAAGTVGLGGRAALPPTEGRGKRSGTIHAYPTLAEMAHKLGDQVQRTRLTPTARKMFSWIYRRARA